MKKKTHFSSRLLPAVLMAITGSSRAAVDISTAVGSGADTYLTNDGNSGPGANLGTIDSMEIREADGVRMRHLYFRFDISSVAGQDLSGASITINGLIVNRNRPMTFRGVVDGAAGGLGEAWDENAVSFNSAAGIDPATPLSAEALFTAEATPVARTAGSALGPNTTQPSTDLDDFVAADTNGLVTFIVTLDEVDNNSEDFYFTSKEAGTGLEPFISFPNATGNDSDSDGITDQWEIDNFGDTVSYVGTDDPDNDNFDNIAEEAAGSDPNDPFSVPGDIDGDDLADLWEDANFGNNDGTPTALELALQDGFGDPDEDFGTNDDEETAGTAPQDYDSFLDAEGGTGDGLNDWWETYYFGDTSVATDPNGDHDSDTYSNVDEYNAFSDPNNSSSFPGDIDGDSLNDLWEDHYFGNNDGIVTIDDITATDDPLGDPDNDTFSNKAENDALPVASNPNNGDSIPGDSDADGLADQWELDHFSDITTQNGADDSDGDLYSNEEEETAGTNPADLGSFIDSEPDGLNDRWEQASFGDLTSASSPDDDADNDTISNYDEYLAGSNPNNPDSFPGDIDGDDLADDFELAYFGSIDAYSGADDPDKDFATNEEEESALPFETDPTVRISSPDTDGDTLGDAWEIFSFGDLTSTDEPGERDAGDPTLILSGDPDNDGYTNFEEYEAATSGNDTLSSPDTDGDGLPEGWERFYFAGDETTQNGTDDSDLDGAINLIELYAGTNPADSNSTPAAAFLPTSLGRGADTELSNDSQNATTGPDSIHGTDVAVSIRNNRASRLHIPMFRFDRSLISGDTSDAILQMHIPWVTSSSGTINVYGLIDGDPGEDWPEATTSYSNAPGLIEDQRGVQNIWARDPAKWILLGTMTPTTTGIVYSSPETLDLSWLIENDSDGLITIAMDTSNANRWHGITMKEEGINPAPTLILPLGVVTVPTTSNPKIASVSLDPGTNILTLITSGLAVGSPYHMESSTGLVGFSAVSGSTFTAATESDAVQISIDPLANSKEFFRLSEGAEP